MTDLVISWEVQDCRNQELHTCSAVFYYLMEYDDLVNTTLIRPERDGSVVSAAEEYRADLARKLLETHSHVDDEDCLKDGWRRVKESMLSAFRTVCPAHLTRLNEHWISSRSADLISVRQAILATSARRSLKHRIIRRLKNDREHRWILKAQEIEKAVASGNSRTLFLLIPSTGQKKIVTDEKPHLKITVPFGPIRSTGQKKIGVGEPICEKDRKGIHSQNRRLERWGTILDVRFSLSSVSRKPTNQTYFSCIILKSVKAPQETDSRSRTCIRNVRAGVKLLGLHVAYRIKQWNGDWVMPHSDLAFNRGSWTTVVRQILLANPYIPIEIALKYNKYYSFTTPLQLRSSFGSSETKRSLEI
ncbi:ATP-binding cassette transporter [Clonorchis sinensis]|uniref:ATP-binding cassette transporter n=1 Tax=Clonorchis sinensis TaxID=79923 RepID=G7YW39_CLOSI|nr:ATP-binding cassette transporter [Clonorchis sinensis]